MNFKSLSFLITVLLPGLANVSNLSSQPVQEQEISGVITDQETKEPIPGVHVYLSETTIGSTTKNDGSFRFTTQLAGSYKLVVSYVGYKSETRDLNLNEGDDPITLNIELTPMSSELEELEVKASNSEWQNLFSEFRDYFLGESQFAKEIIIENAWSINFEVDNNSLIASAPGPIVISNHALGYEVEIDLVEFKWNRNLDSGLYVLYSRFNEMQTDDSETREKWLENREKAYTGSFEHFLRSLYHDNLTSNRFEAVLKGTSNRIEIAEVIKVGGSKGMNIHTNIPGTDSEHTKTFRLRGPTDILYGRKTGYSNSDTRDRSRLTPLNRSGSFAITEQGKLVNPSSLRIDGAWAKDRVAELLPVTYAPAE